MSITDLYPVRMRQTQDALTGAAEAWLEDVMAQFSLVRTTASGRVYPADALERVVQVTKGLIKANVRYTVGVVSASMGVVGSMGHEASEGAQAVKDGVSATVTKVGQQVEHFGDDIVDNAEELRRAERAEARRAKKAARDAAAERYEHMTKVELSDELEKRNLHKTGNVDELRERLIEADLETATA